LDSLIKNTELYKMQLNPFLSGTLLSLVEAVGDYSLKRYATGAGSLFFGVGFAIYGLLAVILSWTFQSNGMAIVNTFWDGTSNIVNMLVAALLLKESYSFKQWLGMSIVSLGLFLINN
jgi:multidrug transporter EmrE-like cation transporter